MGTRPYPLLYLELTVRKPLLKYFQSIPHLIIYSFRFLRQIDEFLERKNQLL